MNRAERRRQARQQEKNQLPLNPALTLAQITGSEAARKCGVALSTFRSRAEHLI